VINIAATLTFCTLNPQFHVNIAQSVQ